MIVGAMVVGATIVVGAMIVGAIIVGAMIVREMIVGTMIVGAVTVGAMGRPRLKATTANISVYTVVTLHWQCMHWYGSCISTIVEWRIQGIPLTIHPKIIARHVEATASFGWLLKQYHTVQHATDGTDPNDHPQMHGMGGERYYYSARESDFRNVLSHCNIYWACIIILWKAYLPKFTI